MLRTRLLLFVIWLLLIVPLAAHAQTGGSVINAASCQQNDVNAVINGPKHTAKNGDTIQIPAGICTWNSGITISGVGFTIVGAGTPNTLPSQVGAGTSTTTLIDNASALLFSVSAIPFGQTMRISTLTIQPVGGAGANSIIGAIQAVGVCTASGCPNLRVDNVTFPVSWDGPLSGGLILADNVFGVLDHNNASGVGLGPPLVQINHASWQGVGDYGDNSFAAADSFGTNQALYLENNLLAGARGIENDVGPQIGGGRVVCRYNTSNPTSGTGVCSSHGTAWSGRGRGLRQIEFYRNSVTVTTSGDSATGLDSGTGYYFENHFASAGAGFFNAYISLDIPRSWHSIAPWNFCDGSVPYDTNDGTVYASGTVTSGGAGTFTDSTKSWTTNQFVNAQPYSIHNVTRTIGADISANTSNQYSLVVLAPYNSTWTAGDSYQLLRATVCIDQIGRSRGTLYSGSTPSPASAANQTLDPLYEWADTKSGSVGAPVELKSGAQQRLVPNRDYYIEVSTSAQTTPAAPFNGSTGTGFGTLANRPTTCTTGVAYWATDQGSWNVSGDGQGSGQLYKCTSTNAWTLSYTPYTYPHPLITGGTSAGGSPNPPMSLTATVQ
jgi:hypothetical protein